MPAGQFVPHRDAMPVEFGGRTWPVEATTPDAFEGVDIAIFSAGGGGMSTDCLSLARLGSAWLASNITPLKSGIPIRMTPKIRIKEAATEMAPAGIHFRQLISGDLR